MALVWRVIEMPDGRVEILKPPPKARRPGEPDEDFCQRIYDDTMSRPGSKYVGRPYVDVEPSTVPASREKRAGWRLVGGAVVEDDAAFQAARATEERKSFDGQKLLKAVVLWQAQLHGKTSQQARDEILVIYRGLA